MSPGLKMKLQMVPNGPPLEPARNLIGIGTRLSRRSDRSGARPELPNPRRTQKPQTGATKKPDEAAPDKAALTEATNVAFNLPRLGVPGNGYGTASTGAGYCRVTVEGAGSTLPTRGERATETICVVGCNFFEFYVDSNVGA